MTNIEYENLVNKIPSTTWIQYESKFNRISCELLDNILYENTGKLHEKKLLELCLKFIKEYPNAWRKIEEDDIKALPYKPENAKEVRRRYILGNLNGEIKEVYMVQLSNISGQIKRTFEDYINKKLKEKDYQKDNPINIIKPYFEKNNIYDFEMKTDSKLVYMLVIKLNNGKIYTCTPITNRTPTQFSQRDSKKAKSVVQALYSDEKIGTLYDIFSSLIGKDGINKNPKFWLNLYEIDNINLIELEEELKNFEIILKIFKIMKGKKEALNKNQKVNNYPPSPSNSEVSKVDYNSDDTLEFDYPSPCSSDIEMEEANEDHLIEDDAMEVDEMECIDQRILLALDSPEFHKEVNDFLNTLEEWISMNEGMFSGIDILAKN